MALIILLSAIWVARGDVADAGTDPPGEGIAVVYIAVGTGFADALGVGPGAGLNGAPIILVPTNPPLDTATEAELIRLDPRKVIIVGGTSAVSASMESTLVTLLPAATVSRIAGTNRYKTNAAFSQLTFPIEYTESIPAAAFHGLTPATDAVTYGVGLVYNTTTGFLYAPIQLPDGAKIIELSALAFDNDGGTVTIQLHRQTSVTEMIAQVVTVGTSAVPVTVFTGIMTADTEIVDNYTYSYMVSITGADGGPQYLHSVRVTYELGASGA